MRAASLLPLLLCCLGSLSAQAQSPAPTPEQPPVRGQRPDQTIERIHVEGETTRIDELRVGGETKEITVSPKGNLPPYQVRPDTGTEKSHEAERRGAPAPSGWKVLGF